MISGSNFFVFGILISIWLFYGVMYFNFIKPVKLNSINSEKHQFNIKWYRSVRFTLSFYALLIFIVAVVCFLLLSIYVVKNILIESEIKALQKTGRAVVGNIGQITKSTETLTKALANVSESSTKNSQKLKALLPNIIYQPGLTDIVAGGGMWPLAYEFEPEKERNSFFWARDKNNEIQFLNDYNIEGAGYHHEEWFVPVTHKPEDRCHWSESYKDAYSFEPMVTCSVPMKYKDRSLYGVATIDIKLSGLTRLIKETTASIDGYAFIVDRNNKFLSYPDLSKAKEIKFNAFGKEEREFIKAEQFSTTYPEFAPISNQLTNINQTIISTIKQKGVDIDTLARQLAADSYQISSSESILLAAILSNKSQQYFSKNHIVSSLKVNDDVLLGESALVQVFLLPETYWKLVLVTPERIFSKKIDSAMNQIIYYILAIVLFIFVLGYWLVGHVVIHPFKAMVSQLSSDSESPLDETSGNEFALLARKFNNKTMQFRESTNQLIIAMDKRKRADELRSVSEKRFKAIARTAPDAIISVDKTGAIVDWNPAATQIFGYSKSEIIGCKYSRLFLPNESSEYVEKIESYLGSEISELNVHLKKVQAIKFDGVIFTAEFSTTSWKTEKGIFFSIFIRDISGRIEAEYKLRHQALHDPLTQLPNRTLFKDRLMSALLQAERSHSIVAVMIIDLDNFKIINDTLGHGVGDKLLQIIADRVSQQKRGTDTIARLGGDEFGVIQTDLNEPSQALLLASKLRESIALPMTIDDSTFQVGCSIGVTVYPDDSTKSETLLRNADMAMYRAKEEGRNSVRFFVEEMDKEIQKRKEILEDITEAIEKNQFELYLQPLISLKDDMPVGAEALIRWHHPDKGMISPADFIPIAEQTNAINEIGLWVVQEVCNLINKMDELKLPKLTIAINISPAQFKRENVFDNLRRTLKSEKVNPCRVECEITESAVMNHVERVIEIMKSLKDEGYNLSIDDFGTGYSSLSYLKQFPINKIKIDRSFIADIETDDDSASIAQAIIQLGHSMNLIVLAEGVETKGQKDWLVGHQCDLVQGYYYAVPMAFDDFVEWLKNTC